MPRRRSRSIRITATRRTRRLSYFPDNLGAGTHDFKVGVQLSWERMAYDRIRNGDILLELRDGVATGRSCPTRRSTRIIGSRPGASFVQDRWMIGRATSTTASASTASTPTCRNSRARPARSSAHGRSRSAMSSTSPSTSRRASASSYDLFGNGRTALKAYYGRFYNQFGSELAEAVNLNALVSFSVTWTDANNNLRLDAGEFGRRFTAFRAACSRASTRTPSRPYSDEINVGVDHQLMPNFAVGGQLPPPPASRRPRHLVDSRPAGRAPYTPMARTYIDPVSGQTAVDHRLQPEPRARARSAIASSPTSMSCESDYDGVPFDVNKRMSNRWQLLAGLTLQRTRASPTAGRTPTRTDDRDFNDPNCRSTATTRGLHRPAVDLQRCRAATSAAVGHRSSGKYTARAGDPLIRTSGLVHDPDAHAGERDRLRGDRAAPIAPRR